ncbi:hypothetical protein EBB79_00575 [Parasedimentitalea marina]|uniref:Uncharacterized protein n=1 Tax=Parasedimentitalea marina TaxID=2483033 RepID=A0A3T0MXP4_9RHOB|nr:hypothetical protein [Parasedimentitalea marina]AZV76532.1 hypothetical protein EBB79_00575 [Parasedimentitalea marina]
MKHCLSILFCVATLPALADEPRIEAASASASGDSWTIRVTLSHPDTGWDHYADGWRVLDMEGRELGLRILAHPHEQEQPFTRSLSGVQIPKGTNQVQIQAHCLIDGWGTTLTTITLP